MTEAINISNKELEKPKLEDSAWSKSIRLTINLLINVFILLTVIICVMFAYDSGINTYTLHIILCVLGYQFFVFQGTLVMSKYNTWSLYISRRYRKNIHIGLQILGVILVSVGTVLIVNMKTIHFTTIHGLAGLAALTFCLMSLINGPLTRHLSNPRFRIRMFWIKYFHFITGISTLFFATGSLVAAYEYTSFTRWLAHDFLTRSLIVITWIVTILVPLDFWILTLRRVWDLI